VSHKITPFTLHSSKKKKKKEEKKNSKILYNNSTGKIATLL